MTFADATSFIVQSCGIAVMAKTSAPGRTKTPARSAADRPGGRRLQYRVSAGYQRQHSRRGKGPAYPALHGVWPARALVCRVLQGRAAGRGRAAPKPVGLISATASMAPSINS